MAIETLPAPVSRSPRIVGMRCRACGNVQPIGLSYVCPACFGPLEVDYDYSVVGSTLTREAIAGRSPGIWRYAELLPVDEPPTRGLPVGSTPAACASPLSAWHTRITLSRDGDNVPYVSYAIRTGPSDRPQSSANARGRSRYWVATVPTEPAAVFDADMAPRAIIPPAPLYDARLAPDTGMT